MGRFTNVNYMTGNETKEVIFEYKKGSQVVFRTKSKKMAKILCFSFNKIMENNLLSVKKLK